MKGRDRQRSWATNQLLSPSSPLPFFDFLSLLVHLFGTKRSLDLHVSLLFLCFPPLSLRSLFLSLSFFPSSKPPPSFFSPPSFPLSRVHLRHRPTPSPTPPYHKPTSHPSPTPSKHPTYHPTKHPVTPHPSPSPHNSCPVPSERAHYAAQVTHRLTAEKWRVCDFYNTFTTWKDGEVDEKFYQVESSHPDVETMFFDFQKVRECEEKLGPWMRGGDDSSPVFTW